MRIDYAATREQVRELDRIAIEQYGMDGLILMENAGRWCARAAERMLGAAEGRTVAVFCGRGNNGGDGFVVARHLVNWGAEVHIVLLAPLGEVLRDDGEAAMNARIAHNMGIPVTEAQDSGTTVTAVEAHAGDDLLIDALLGTGVTGELREPYGSAIKALNRCTSPVLAVDVPSGLDCDTGEPLGAAVRATRTVTFVFSKRGFRQPGAADYTGEVEVAEISIPRTAIEHKLAEWQAEEG